MGDLLRFLGAALAAGTSSSSSVYSSSSSVGSSSPASSSGVVNLKSVGTLSGWRAAGRRSLLESGQSGAISDGRLFAFSQWSRTSWKHPGSATFMTCACRRQPKSLLAASGLKRC